MESNGKNKAVNQTSIVLSSTPFKSILYIFMWKEQSRIQGKGVAGRLKSFWVSDKSELKELVFSKHAMFNG